MEMIIKINLDNEAFQDDYVPEVIRIVQELIDNDLDKKTLRDINGNLVGSVIIR